MVSWSMSALCLGKDWWRQAGPTGSGYNPPTTGSVIWYLGHCLLGVLRYSDDARRVWLKEGISTSLALSSGTLVLVCLVSCGGIVMPGQMTGSGYNPLSRLVIWYFSTFLLLYYYHPSSIIHRPSSIILHPSSIIHHPSSIIHYPLSILRHPSSIIHYPSSIIHHPSSIIHNP